MSDFDSEADYDSDADDGGLGGVELYSTFPLAPRLTRHQNVANTEQSELKSESQLYRVSIGSSDSSLVIGEWDSTTEWKSVFIRANNPLTAFRCAIKQRLFGDNINYIYDSLLNSNNEYYDDERMSSLSAEQIDQMMYELSEEDGTIIIVEEWSASTKEEKIVEAGPESAYETQSSQPDSDQKIPISDSTKPAISDGVEYVIKESDPSLPTFSVTIYSAAQDGEKWPNSQSEALYKFDAIITDCLRTDPSLSKLHDFRVVEYRYYRAGGGQHSIKFQFQCSDTTKDHQQTYEQLRKCLFPSLGGSIGYRIAHNEMFKHMIERVENEIKSEL